MQRTIRIGNRLLGGDQPPFIVAEMSGNHGGTLEGALAVVEAAAHAGAHALKLQTYTADTMTLDIAKGEFVIREPGLLWKNENLYGLFQRAHTPWEWHPPIFERCRQLGLECFSAAFDLSAVAFLEELKAPAYKIASPENVDVALIRAVAATGKPVLISTGMANLAELAEAVRAAREAGCCDLVLLKCTSAYPASPEDSNLATIPHMRELFGVEVGLSDHTLGIGAALAAIALGARVIEKHLVLDRSGADVDAAFSLEPEEFARLTKEAETAWRAIGTVRYEPTDAERKAIPFRRSLYVVRDVRRGEALTPENLRAIRPGLGLAPRYLDLVMGRKVSRDVKKGTALAWDLIGELRPTGGAEDTTRGHRPHGGRRGGRRARKPPRPD
jgi:N-acetylneuraminate synthase